VNWLFAAICSIAASNRSRRVRAISTASWSASNAARNPEAVKVAA
jgi:hypothetical protein